MTKPAHEQWQCRRKHWSSNSQDAWSPYISDGDTARVLCFANLSGAYNGYEGNEQAEKDFQKMAAANELIEALIDMLENGDARSRQMARAALRKAGVTV